MAGTFDDTHLVNAALDVHADHLRRNFTAAEPYLVVRRGGGVEQDGNAEPLAGSG
ncbi:hypothetical protein FHX82_005175 [Amycolatopsis bartoniae]|uniref:Uncharacterized protein n=1 Tax=Amycolatopsis bartoniae TaxID=941986 RepID=A0A8H9M2Q2_9PSEU|nr:hypothetical protein [Amycolatopsis bartoniae]MBB2938099.1 hypothetical protein [Amycolatopsis bartoniae]GHF32655.1 hypothetical protein GCM10017566_01550 [Amycolatopsis bartoniae]